MNTYRFKKSIFLLNLIVRNVDPYCTLEEFELFFSNFGTIKRTKLIAEAGIGFVCFTDRESARQAKENPSLMLKNRRLDVNFCEPKEQRQKR